MSRKTDIRNAIVTRLQGISTFAGRVYPGRRHAMPTKNLPCACVYVLGSRKSSEELGGCIGLRERTFGVQLHCAPGEDLDAKLDELTDQVEAALLADDDLGGLVSSFELDKEDYAFDEYTGEKLGMADARYTALYIA